MIKITMISHDGERHELDAEPGISLMEAAVNNAIPGIDGDCGGACACGTCHIKVAPEWQEQTGTPGSDEASMLSMTPEKADNSRLACQIQLDESLNGLVVEMPEFQM